MTASSKSTSASVDSPRIVVDVLADVGDDARALTAPRVQQGATTALGERLHHRVVVVLGVRPTNSSGTVVISEPSPEIFFEIPSLSGDGVTPPAARELAAQARCIPGSISCPSIGVKVIRDIYTPSSPRFLRSFIGLRSDRGVLALGHLFN